MLRIDDNDLSDEYLEAIAGSRSLPNLRVLRLGPKPLSERAMRALEGARTLRSGVWEVFDRYVSSSP